jgi:hypothetical protein
MLLQFFDPDDLGAAVVNWEEVAGDLIRHLHDEVAAVPGMWRPVKLAFKGGANACTRREEDR